LKAAPSSELISNLVSDDPPNKLLYSEKELIRVGTLVKFLLPLAAF
jgi:hypothetical protein